MTLIFKIYDKISVKFLKNYLPLHLHKYIEKKPLTVRGRWGNIVNDNKDVNQKHIDITSNLANHDNCGPCGIETIKKYNENDN